PSRSPAAARTRNCRTRDRSEASRQESSASRGSSLSFLLRQFRSKFLFLLRDERPVTVRIDEGLAVTLLQSGVLAVQIEVVAMRTKEDVARQRLQDAKHLLVVGGNLRIAGVVDELVAGIHVGAADDHDVVSRPTFPHGDRPGGAAFRVTGREMRG